jgi:tRNA (cytidine32/uridine32-2'-O)-methyltransferase
MAVQVVCYEIFQFLEKTSIQVSAEGKQEQSQLSGLGTRIWDKEPASGQQIDGLMEHLETLMVQSDFIAADNPGQTVTRLRRLFMRQRLDETEVQILRGLLKAIQGKMR